MVSKDVSVVVVVVGVVGSSGSRVLDVVSNGATVVISEGSSSSSVVFGVEAASCESSV